MDSMCAWSLIPISIKSLQNSNHDSKSKIHLGNTAVVESRLAHVSLTQVRLAYENFGMRV